jgi:thioredoxin reductase (NADPH)
VRRPCGPNGRSERGQAERGHEQRERGDQGGDAARHQTNPFSHDPCHVVTQLPSAENSQSGRDPGDRIGDKLARHPEYLTVHRMPPCAVTRRTACYDRRMIVRDLVIVGAGPAGLATAIAASGQGLDYLIVEKGALVNSIYHFPAGMTFFTTPELLEIGGMPLVSPYEKPTRVEALRYYRRVADAYRLTVALGEEVVAIERTETAGEPLFRLETRRAHGLPGEHRARAVVMAIGYYDHPNLLDVPGESLPHVSHYYRDAHECYRQRVVVVGGKNSAAETSLELHRAGARVTLVHRRPKLGDSIKYWVKPDIENRIAEGSIAARFNTEVVEIRPDAVIVRPAGNPAAPVEGIPADRVFLMTGYHADSELLAAAGVTIDAPTGVPVYDAASFETTVPNLFVAGGVVAGKDTAPIFIENGRFHGEAIVRTISQRQTQA